MGLGGRAMAAPYPARVSVMLAVQSRRLLTARIEFLGTTPSGKRRKEARLETNGQVLTDFVRSVAGHKHICLEEGTQAEWLYEMLEPLADEVVVELPERSNGVKNDSVDAWQRADELRRGDIKRMVYKAPRKFTALRAAARSYEVTQRDMVRSDEERALFVTIRH